MKRKSTIRKMRGMPVSRDYYRTLSQVQGLLTRLENLGKQVERLELDASAMNNRARFEKMLEGAKQSDPFDEAGA